MNVFKKQYIRQSTAETPVEISTPALKQKTVISCSSSLANFPNVVVHETHRSQQCCHELCTVGVVYAHSIFKVSIRHFDGSPEPKGICMLDQTCDDLNIEKKKNITRPFEDQTSLEFFSKKSDCSLFMFGSHNKKRPNNLVIGRMYDHHVLDMIELGIENFVSLKDIKNSKCPEGTKPMLIFAGDDFDVTEDYRRLKSLLIDFFRGPTVSNIRLAGLEYVLHFTALNGKIYFRSYKLLLKKSGCRTPRIELEEMGPSLDLVLRRTHLASDDLYKLSMKMPKALKPKKKKNISHDTFGTTYGRIHMQKQDLSKLQTRKMKGLKKRPAERITEDQEKKSKRVKKN